jgi:hypothetical protein
MIRGYSWIGVAVVLLMVVSPLCGRVKITPKADRISVEIDVKPYADFFLAPGGNKPFLYPLRTASGIIVTRHYPIEEGEAKDHPWHHGLYFAHGAVNGTDFWNTEPGNPDPRKGHMVLKKVLVTKGGAKSGTIQASFEGFSQSGKLLMTETRTINFYPDPQLRIIDYEITVEPATSQNLTFEDTKEGTFGMRLATALSEDHTGKMVNAEGKETEKNVWGKRSPWVDYYGQVDGTTVGVAIMDHPSNPRHPTYWHSRAYGLFAANPFGVKDFTGNERLDGKLTVGLGEHLTFRYRVVIHAGDCRNANIAGLYNRYATGP